ncbi:hypothetical protein [Mobilicoccus pelagius]|uniref:Uncharacterized protein n=1 Tax=Mobilicoccus pelagius NBRC 104925 TaxID=1089455 RepID=H5UQ85_9MICO|nr:hypothetical protein [Mobilicoccus pelagius]GAB47893.1 hypothetical protein MOPEL_030_00030 [Mobilicoccus pelagius NBRC 104925]
MHTLTASLEDLRPGDQLLRVGEHRCRPELTVVDALGPIDGVLADAGVRCAPAGPAADRLILRRAEVDGATLVIARPETRTAALTTP